MKTALLCVIALSLLILSLGCKKIHTPTEESELIFGEWEWVGASGGFSGGSITPESEGYTLRITFKENGTLIYYKNNKRASRNRFSLQLDNSSSINQYKINYKHTAGFLNISTSQLFHFEGSDTLVMRDECSECYALTYIRKK